MPRGLKDGTAIVTGGATLIGQAVVRAFHDSWALGARGDSAEIERRRVGDAVVCALLKVRPLFWTWCQPKRGNSISPFCGLLRYSSLCITRDERASLNRPPTWLVAKVVAPEGAMRPSLRASD